ncbi:MAG: DNA starvation/stationary phase protection protein [Erysipelothrix sp.]|jgi:starvation-inducible DNA-binding protein|nr:DNA starvation/stationary phase protection protein [Erysipelothrix sp.]
MIKTMNQYVANLAVLNVKFHNLHWNVVGPQFIPLHQFSESAYEGFFESYDAIAELIKMRGSFPVGSLKDILALSTVKELENKSFSTSEMLAIMKEDFTALIALATQIRKEADEANDFTVVATMEDEIAKYEKHIWFITSMQG